MESYRTLITPARGEIVEKKSRFLAVIEPTPDRAAMDALVSRIKKEHYDARHNCFAGILSLDMKDLRYSDDGEPQGTAGRPMLEVLKGEGLCLVTGVVTRYFGGVLLGTGGLSRAYSGALKEALSSAEIVTMVPGVSLAVTGDYTQTGKLMHVFETLGAKITDVTYTDKVTYTVNLLPELAEGLKKALIEATGGAVAMEKVGEGYSPMQD